MGEKFVAELWVGRPIGDGSISFWHLAVLAVRARRCAAASASRNDEPQRGHTERREREKTLGGLYRMKKRSYLGIHVYTSRGGERETMRLNGLYTCTGHKQELGVKENCL